MTWSELLFSKNRMWGFPGGPVVKTSLSGVGDAGSVPGRGAKIPHAWQPKKQTKTRSNIVTNSTKT